jgi:outer membrane protein assembly factor BamA
MKKQGQSYCMFKKIYLSKWILWSSLFLFSGVGLAQKQFFLQLKTSVEDSIFLKKNNQLSNIYQDSSSLKTALQTWQKTQIDQGFLESNIDDCQQKDSIFTVVLHVGNRYEWMALRKGNVSTYELDKIGFREKYFFHKTFNYRVLANWMERIIGYEENHGYPFATLRLDSILLEKNGKVSADLKIKRGKKIIFGALKLEEDSTKMSPQYLARYLDILPNALFEKNKITSIKNRIRELPFLSLDREPYLTFEQEKAIVHLNLKRKAASRFDALLGILPENGALPTDAKRFIVTGTLNLDLWNALNKGERIQVDFQRFKANQQQIKANFNLPFVANLPIGADANIDIYRRDSTFTTIQYALGGRYILGGNDFVKIYWQAMQNNIGKIDTNQVLLQKRLPDNLDVDASSYGIEWQKQHLDYRFNPRKGWHFSFKTDIGSRKIIKNNTITDLKSKIEPSFNFGSLYDTLPLRSLRLQGHLQTEFYLPLFARSTLKIALQGSGLFTQTPVFKNEQQRIGGNRLLRGFDEESIFATRFLFSNVEYRFLIGQNSFFSLFSDAAYVENVTRAAQTYDHYIGFGAGLNFETRAGIFSLNYALGKKNKNPIDFGAGKIHFGYISIF